MGRERALVDGLRFVDVRRRGSAAVEAMDRDGKPGAAQLGHDKARHASRRDPGEAVAEHPPDAAAGFANDVDAVNQYAAPIYAATVAATRPGGERRMTSTSPNVATASASHWPDPPRTFVESCRMPTSNIACASQAPDTAPSIWTRM
jgi:hypothetical protein